MQEDRELLAELVAKLLEIEEQLSIARLETAPDSLLASRIRHLFTLAQNVRSGVERLRQSGG
jgi:hypothetical protein